MKNHRLLASACLFAAVLVSAMLPAARASDHADPQGLDAFLVQKSPEANITDLHAFIVDKAGKPILDASRLGEGDQLILSLCVRRALRPDLVGGLNLKGYKFRVHLDLDPPVRFFDEAKAREALAGQTSDVDGASNELEAAKKSGDKKKEAAADMELKAAVTRRSNLIQRQQADRSSQALYGGIVTQPENIADDALLEFELDLVRDDDEPEQSQAFLAAPPRIEGIPGEVNIAAVKKTVNGKVRIPASGFKPGVINVQAGVFDDPFIFPRFFRRNVVGIVTSIPLTSLPVAVRNGPIMLWATTHKGTGEQIDHVGRSLRTQLPRFGYLNEVHPSGHVREITRVHDKPTVMDDVLATFLAPLIAHRHYDSVPDVMIYDLRRPPSFPNGRWLDDDVSAPLAAAGETLLVELSYAESRQFPRATTNDKQFDLKFPYLAPRWTAKEVAAYAQSGTTMPGKQTAAMTAEEVAAGPKTWKPFVVPRAGDSAAIAFPTFKDATWRTLWLIVTLLLIAVSILLFLALRTFGGRFAVVVITLVTLCLLHLVRTENLPTSTAVGMARPSAKVGRLALGGGVIVLFTGLLIFAAGRRLGAKYAHPEPNYPPMRQELMTDEATSPPLYGSSTYTEIADALFGDPVKTGRYYKNWGEAGQKPLPIYRVTTALLAQGLFRAGRDFAMLSAARRTLKSRADLRWGPDGKGWHRIVHTMGVCLEGNWKIDEDPKEGSYTGYFKKGSEGRVIARYSLGGNEVRNSHKRSLSMVGKVFPLQDAADGPTPRAHFITQEDLGGAYTDSVIEAQLTNSPPVTLHNRGNGVFSFLIVIAGLMQADKEPSERQLYEIAELEKPADEKTRCPRFMRLTIDKEQNYPTVVGDEADFREEILGLIYKGSGTPRPLVFNIEVSDQGERTRLQKVKGQEWKRIGQITFKQAAASHNGDFVIHFHHPVWRNDRNNPGSVARAEHKS